MTTGANSLTGRANPAPAGATALPMVPSGGVRVLVEALGAMGHDRVALMRSAGLDPAALLDPDALVPCTAYGGLIEHAQGARFTPNLGLKVAMHVPVGAYPLLDYVILTAPTVGEGMHRLARYFAIVGNPMRIEIEDAQDPIRLAFLGGTDTFATEYSIGLAVLHLTEETDGRFVAGSAHMRHVPDDAAEFERVLGCAVETGASWDGLRISGESWRQPLRRRDPILSALLERQAADALPATSDGGLVAGVRRALIARIAAGEDPRIDVVARELATSSRTLQRRLAAQGLSFQQMIDEVRRDAAGRYLLDRSLAVAEIAYLMGYSEPAPFHRAFKRWFGLTPQEYRTSRQRPVAS